MKRSPFQRGPANLRVALTETEAEILLYDEISWWGITAEAFKRELDAITVGTINLRINSPGGDVFDALAIYNAVREHPARVITHIDGVAASMASVVALAGDEVRMAENAFLMIHDPWALVIGNSTDLRQEADLLDKVAGSLHMAYEQKTGKSRSDIDAWMKAETWFTGEEARAAGFVDEVITTAKDEKLAALFDLSIFAHVPDVLRDTPEPHEPTARDLERALRDVGLSQIAAKQYIAAGRAAALPQRDAGEAGERDVTPEPVRKPVLIAI